MVIKVLGTGCSKCEQLMEEAKKAASAKGIEATFEKVTGIAEIMGYGVMSTPGLVINEKVVFSGRVAMAEEIETLL